MINIAIDGHAGSGKSTVAKMLANKLNYKLLNTGEIYRSVTCFYIDANLGEPTECKLKKILKNMTIKIEFIDKEQFVYINDLCFRERLRNETVAVLTSKISTFKVVRDKILQLQRDFAKNNNCVMEGRDIGTVVLPNADIKFFMTATQEERARRRFLEVKDKNETYDSVLEDLKERDSRDMNREIAPLKPAQDSIIIDNTGMSIDENVEKCLQIIAKKLKVQN